MAEAVALDTACLDDPDARISLAQENALWSAAATLCGDQAFGLHVAGMIRPGMFDVLDYVVRTAPTLRHALDRLARYNRLMHDVAEFSVLDGPGGVRIEHRFRVPGVTPARHAAEFTLASLLAVAGQMAERAPTVVAVGFAHAAPADTTVPRAVFGVVPQFSVATSFLLLSAESVQARVPAADAALSRIVSSHAEQLLARLGPVAEESLLARVRQAILAGMAEGEAKIGLVARRLGCSERSLQRALQAEGTTFNALFDDLRKRTALDFIADPQVALGEIAYLLGFSEPSAFHRAFRRWTGITPLAARRASRSQA